MGRWSDDISYAVITFRLALLLCWLNNTFFFSGRHRLDILFKIFTSKEEHVSYCFDHFYTAISWKKQRGKKSSHGGKILE